MKQFILGAFLALAAFSAGYYCSPGKQDFSHEALEIWASSVVVHQWPEDKSGIYDICYSRARKGMEILDMDTNIPYETQDACAIIMHGAEW